MDKFNEFCEKYEIVLWQLCAAIWFFVEFACNQKNSSILWDGIIWVAFAIVEYIRIRNKNNKK